MTTTTEQLSKGKVTTIECGDLNVRVYSTNDAINDQVILLDRAGKGVVIELPGFRDSIEEMTAYIKGKDISIEGKLVSYHAAGSSFLPDVKSYMTDSSVAYNTDGEGAQLIKGFTGAFGSGFDSGTVNSGERIGAGTIGIGGIELEIIPNGDAFEVYIPAAKAVYVHMIGHDCHSIVGSPAHADSIIRNLRGYLDRGTQIFLSSHYGPETREDVEAKIAYLQELKDIAAGSEDREDFKARVNAMFPGYSGSNYLDMTAGFLFRD
jgi:hypothetical protein